MEVSIKMLSVVELELFSVLVGEITVLISLQDINTASNWPLLLPLVRWFILISSQMVKSNFRLHIVCSISSSWIKKLLNLPNGAL